LTCVCGWLVRQSWWFEATYAMFWTHFFKVWYVFEKLAEY